MVFKRHAQVLSKGKALGIQEETVVITSSFPFLSNWQQAIFKLCPTLKKNKDIKQPVSDSVLIYVSPIRVLGLHECLIFTEPQSSCEQQD